MAPRFAALDASVITSAWDPDRCPVDDLPFLAWQFGLDLWDDGWPETRKREAVRKALWLHSLKTTPAGIKAHVALTGAEVLKITRPPARGFLRAAMDDAQRAAWLDGLPQIRIYPFYHRATVRARQSFSSDPGGMRFHGPAARSHLLSTRALKLYGRRATMFDRGIETEITLSDALDGSAERVFITRKAPAAHAFHGRGALGSTFLTASATARLVITLRASDSAQSFAIDIGSELVDVRPQRIAQRRVAPASRSFFGRHGGFLRTSFGPILIYDRFCLLDPSRMVARRRVLSFHGHGRFGIPAFTAELRIAVPMLRRRPRSGRWHGSGYRKAPSFAALDKAIEAVTASKAARDTIHIDTTTHRRAQFGRGLRFGEFTFGEIRKAA
jgi:hypothetical protein